VAGALEGSVTDDSSAQRLLFNWITLNGKAAYPPDTIEKMREAWQAVLSGQRDEISYDRTYSVRDASPAVVVTARNTVTRSGQEELLIGGQRVNTVRLKTTYKVIGYNLNANSETNFSWNLWYAPELHIFVKGQFAGNPGRYLTGGARPTPPDFEVTSVQRP
jgi:hypothetical protein